jgi:glycosyltransferase involved in cell wall biosynthesis
VLTDQTACLVEPTGEAFAEGILLLLGNAQLRAELGVAGRAFAEEKYSFNAYKEKVRYAYQALAGSARKVADSTAVVGD